MGVLVHLVARGPPPLEAGGRLTPETPAGAHSAAAAAAHLCAVHWSAALFLAEQGRHTSQAAAALNPAAAAASFDAARASAAVVVLAAGLVAAQGHAAGAAFQLLLPACFCCEMLPGHASGAGAASCLPHDVSADLC